MKSCYNCKYSSGRTFNKNGRWFYCDIMETHLPLEAISDVKCTKYEPNTKEPQNFFDICQDCEHKGEYGDSRNPKYACHHRNNHDLPKQIPSPLCIFHLISEKSISDNSVRIIRNYIELHKSVSDKLAEICDIVS